MGIELALVQLGPVVGLASSSVTDGNDRVGVLVKLLRFVTEVVVGLGRSESSYLHAVRVY